VISRRRQDDRILAKSSSGTDHPAGAVSLSILLEGTGRNRHAQREQRRKRQHNEGGIEAEWQCEVYHPAQYQQRHRRSLCPVIDKRALAAPPQRRRSRFTKPSTSATRLNSKKTGRPGSVWPGARRTPG